MRTTLKRGIGRGAEVNGNGRSVLPPGALSPVTLYRQPPPPQPGFGAQVGRFFAWLAVTVLMLVVGLVGGFYLWAHESAAALQAHTFDAKRSQARLDPVPDAKQPAVALVIGYDHRAGERGLPSRSDTMMLIRADPSTKTISLLSFPRDLDVPIYCPGQTASGARNGPATVIDHGRINTAYAYCGSTGALETVRHLTNLPVNYLISVNFLGFIAVVNKLGGVWMDIDRRYYNKNVGTSSTDFANIDLQPGYQRLTGKQALDFVRYRHTDSDLFRLARQQQFVSATRQQIAKSIGPEQPRGDREHDRAPPLPRDRRRRGRPVRPRHGLQLREVRLRPAARARVPGEDRRDHRPERAHHRLDQHLRPWTASSTRTSRPGRPPPRSRSAGRSRRVTRPIAPSSHAHGAERQRPARLGLECDLPARARRATGRCCRPRTSPPTRPTGTTSARRSTSTRRGRATGGRRPSRSRSSSAAPTSSRCRRTSPRSRTVR